MTYYGSWAIDNSLTFCANTHSFSTGAAVDADSPPAYRVYEDETGTPILTGTMALLDSANTAGFYSEQITLSAANGFEKGKCYSVYISAAVNSVTASLCHNFQIEAEVDSNTITDKTGYRLSATGVDDFWDEQVDGTVTGRQSIRLANSANAAKTSGMDTTTGVIRDLADSKARITATLDGAGNRTAVTVDVT